jgi:general secretion pathway protein L
VRIKPMPAMPVAQALAAERLGAAEGLGGERHVAVAANAGGTQLLVASVAKSDMDLWLAECAAAGFEPDAMVPAALALPEPDSGAAIGELAGQPLARTREAAFAGEPALVEALAGGTVREIGEDAIADGAHAVHLAPPLDLRQGQYAPRRVSFFLVPDWLRLAPMAAVAAVLAAILMLVWTVKWNMDSSSREDAALAAVQQRFPAATDLDSAERLVAAELARRGQGGAAFSAPAAAVLAALKPQGAVTLRDIGYGADGTLRFTAASPRADAINEVLLALQRDGWQVTVPPALAPDPTGATVAAITVRAP